MSFGPPRGIQAYDWFRQMQIKKVADTSGLQIATLKPSDPGKVCGRMLDTSVVVGKAGIPINSDYIDPSMIQGHVFNAPTFTIDHGNPNLLHNPSAEFGEIGWTQYDNHGVATYAFANSKFSISCNGSVAIDSGLYQTVKNVTPGQVMTVSGFVEVDTITAGEVYVDIFDANVGYVIQPVNITTTQPSTYFSASFTVPSDGSVLVRIRIYNGAGGTGAISAVFSNLKLEAGSTATPFVPGAFTAISEIDITGAIHSIPISVGITNIPNGTVESNGQSAVGIVWYYKNTLSKIWTTQAQSDIPGLPYPLMSQILQFNYGQVGLGINYDFACAFVDLQGNVGPMGVFATNWSPDVNEFKISSSYMSVFDPTFVPVLAAPASFSTPLSANGLTSSVQATFTIINQPTDGSLSRIGLWYRVTPAGGSGTSALLAPFTYYASIAAGGVGQSLLSLSSSAAYAPVFTDLTNGTSYDFAISGEDTSGGETGLAYIGSAVAALLALPSTALPSVPANTVIVISSPSSTQVGATGQSSYYSQITFSLALTDGLNGPSVNPSPWLAQINILSKSLANTTPDNDVNPKDYTLNNTIYTTSISNPIQIVVGPFPGGQDFELAVQLVDQAGNASGAKDILVITPPTMPQFDSNGNLEYISYGTAITSVITSNGTLANGTVGPQQMANPVIGANIIFNPSGFYGLNGWQTANGRVGPCNFATDQYAGGRFRMYYTGGQSMDSAIFQTIANLFAGLTMTLSGWLEIDTSSDAPNTYAGFDVVDATTNVVIANHYDTSGTHSAQFFQFSFTVPSNASGNIISIRMRAGNNGNGGSVDAYFYKLKLEHGSPASPYSDDMSTSAVSYTHTPAGTVTIATSTVTGGQIAYNATPGSVQTVINDTYKAYKAGTALAIANGGSTLPYSLSDNAYAVAVGTNGQSTNTVNKNFTVPTTSSAGVVASTHFFLPLGANGAPSTYQILITLSAIGNSASYYFNIYPSDSFGDLRSGSPSGFNGASNLNSTIGTSGTQNLSTVAGAQVSGGQWILARLVLNSGSITTAGSCVIQAIQIA